MNDIGEGNVLEKRVLREGEVGEGKGILLLTMNREKQRNALNSELKIALTETLEKVAREEEIQGVILTGAGEKAFCGGQDLKEVLSYPLEKVEEELLNLYRTLYYFPKPVVAAINGAATGGGFMLALLADMRVVAKEAYFAMTEINIGLPCVNGTLVLHRLLGEARTADLVLRGRALSAQEADNWGLVSKQAEEGLVEEAGKIAQELGEKNPMAFRLNKEWIRAQQEIDWEEARNYMKKAVEELKEAGVLQEQLSRFRKG